MAPQKVYLDDNGNPIPAASKVYLDDNGEPIKPPQAAPGGTLRPASNPVNRDNLTRIEPINPRDPLGKQATTFMGDIGAGGLGLLLHPIRSAEDFTAGLVPFDLLRRNNERRKAAGLPVSERDEQLANAPNPIQSMYEGLNTQPAETIASGIGQGAVLDAAPKAVTRIVPPAFRRGVEMLSGTGPKAAETLAEEAGEANKTAAQKHLDATQDAIHATRGAELTHEQKVAAAKDAADAETKANLKKHIQSRDEQVRARTEAEEKLAAEKAQQARIEPTQAKLKTAWGNLRAGIETARQKALKVGNEKYNAVNEALNPIPADMEKVHGLYYEAAESLGEAQAQPALLNRLGDALKNGAELTYKDLQKLYSDLGKEISKGTLTGSTFHAFDVLHEGIGDDMQRIADGNGQGAQLTDARNYWRRMKQTFGKQFTMNDAATGALKHSASGLAAEDAEANQIRLLGSFDEDIPRLFSHVANIEKGADALPKPVSARELEQGTKAPPIPPRKPVAPKVEPKPVAPPERVAPPDRPALQTITPEAVKNAKADAMLTRAGHIATRGSMIAAWPLYHVFSSIARGGALSELGTMGLESGATLAGVQAVAHILRNPKAVEFLSKATPRDVAAIPPELRSGNWQAVIDGAKKKGIPISPAVLALANPPRPRHPVFSAQSPVQ